jgi:hypothetical protein
MTTTTTMSTGTTIIGMMVIGYTCPTDTIVSIMYGGIRGGGIGIGRDATGAITGHGISSTLDSI